MERTAERPHVKSEFSTEEMLQSAAERADRERQQGRDCAEGQGGTCRKCQRGRRSGQTATAEEAHNGGSFTDENRPAKGWDSRMCTRHPRAALPGPWLRLGAPYLGLGFDHWPGIQTGRTSAKDPTATESLCAAATATNRLINCTVKKVSSVS